MDYLRAYIPACEAFGWSGGNGFKTAIVQMANGRERRNAEWSQPQHRFTLPFQNISQSQYIGIKQMHLTALGMLLPFLYLDQSDHTADSELVAVATPGQTEFQLTKTSVISGVSFQRKVFALYVPDGDDPGEAVEADPVISVNGVIASGWAFDHDRGVAFPPAPMTGGEVVRWSGQFSIWVRFNQDDLPFSIDNRSGGEFVMNGQVELLEMPPPPEVVS